jgi:uncharacterized protein with FMN-binding domain
MPTTRQKTTVAAIAGLSLLGVVTGCSSAADAVDGAASTPASTLSSGAAADPTTSASEADGSSAAAGYKDGSYTATGSYTSPGGAEEVKVQLTLANDIVTAVTVTPESTNPNGKKYQGEFAQGISAVVVGVNIDSLKVSKVAGSSLTSAGFNDAVNQIKTDATE